MSSELPPYDLGLREVHLREARRRLPGQGYYAVLRHLHELLRPATYIEIGVHDGGSLALARPETWSLAIDPAPVMTRSVPSNARLFVMTSDEFFATRNLATELARPTFSLAFIDGLHLFEQVLRDFINLERHAGRDSVIVLHDCLPLDAVTSSRVRTTAFYSGDVWKAVLCLRLMRPDLSMAIVPTAPTGLCIVGGLDRESTVLARAFDAVVPTLVGLEFADYQMRLTQMPLVMSNTSSALARYVSQLCPSASLPHG